MKQGVLLLAVLSVFVARPVCALDISDHPNVQELQRPEFLPTKPAGEFVLPEVAAPATQTAPGSMGAGRVLQRLRIRGNAVLTTAELEQVAAPWLGKPVSVADLESLRLELTRYYIRRGFINSGAMLGSEELSAEGDVLIDIVEGHLVDVKLSGLDGLDPEYVRAKLLADPETVLNVDALREQFQVLLDDPLFSRLNAQLGPGQKPGEAVLNVQAQRARPYELAIQLNNYRVPSIGEYGLGLTGLVRNILGRGDVLEGYVQTATENTEAYRYGASWRVPLNYTGTSLSLQADEGDSKVLEEPLREINIKSHLSSWEAGLSQLLIDQLHHRFSVGAGYLSRVNNTYLDGIPFSFVAGEPDGVTKAWTTKFWQEYTYRSVTQVFALRSTFSWTDNNIETIPGLPSSAQPASHYRTWLGQLQYANRLTESGVQFVSRVVAQSSSQRLLSMDGFSIGGVNTVRGFRENFLVRDQGCVATVELDFPVLQRLGAHGQSLNLVPFVDYGSGKNHGDTSQALSSAGVAARWRWDDFSLDIAVAARLHKPVVMPPDNGGLQDAGVHLQLAYKL